MSANETSDVQGPELASNSERAPTTGPPVKRLVEIRERPAESAENQQNLAVVGVMASKAWQLAMLLLPIVLTAWLTYLSSITEGRIKGEIDQRSQMFVGQLQLSEELYKRRFDAYEKLHAQLVELNERLKVQGQLRRGSWNKVYADGVAQFGALHEASKLHLSPEVETCMGNAYFAAVRGDPELVPQRINDVEEAMKNELDDWMFIDKAEHSHGTGMSAKKSKAPGGAQ